MNAMGGSVRTFFRKSAIFTIIAVTFLGGLLFLAPPKVALAACSPTELGSCTTQASCVNTGKGVWQFQGGTSGAYKCVAQPSDPAQQCSPTNLGACNSASACVDVGHGVWQFQGGTGGTYNCVAQPSDPAQQCSETNVAACTSEPACVNTAKGVWQFQGGTSGAYKCVAQPSDPAQRCSETNPAACVSEIACTNAKGTWTAASTPGGASTCASDTAGTEKCSDGSAKNAKGECPNDTELNCGGGQLDWLVCGVIGLLGSAADKLDTMMTDMLNINTSDIFDTSQSGGQKGYYAAWNSFRILATALLVIGGLVMVASQALGLEFLDAYTIRKVLPRLLVAVIGISLSWPLMEFVVGFFNTVGTDIRTIMYTPFKNIGGGIDIGVGISTYIGIVVGGLVLGGLGLLSLILTAFLALLVGFVILVIRQLALLVLIILAPVAIACYILPNTQKVSKLWFDNFLGLLMMFPIISALIAAGHIFAAVAFSDGAQTTGFTQLLGLVAYFIPFFLLPMAARLATGVIGTIAGFVNDKNRGVFDRLKKFRGEKAAGNLSAMANGNRFKSENWAANKFNAATHGIANVPNAGFNPMRMKSRMQTAMSRHDMDEAAEFREKSSEFGVIKGNQDFLEAALDGHGNDSKVREILSNLKGADGVSPRYSKDTVDQGVAAIRAARRSASPEVFETAAALSLPSTGTAFKIQRDAQGNITGGGAGEMHQRINQVAGKDRVKASRMLADMRTSAMQARRPLLAGGGYASQLGVMEEQFNGTQSLAGASERIVGESLEGQGGSYIVSARKSDVEAAAPTMISKLVAASNNAKATSQELASIEGKYSAASNFAPENARVIADNVMSKQVALPTVTKQADGSYATEMKTMTVREHIEARRNTDPEFQSMSKQFHAASESTEASLRAAEARSSGGGRRS